MVLDPAPDGVQRPHPGVAQPGEDQLAGDPGPDHLVVDDASGVSRHRVRSRRPWRITSCPAAKP